MQRKQFIVVWVVGICLLSGCAYFSLQGGRAKFTVPFDFPQEQDKNQNITSP